MPQQMSQRPPSACRQRRRSMRSGWLIFSPARVGMRAGACSRKSVIGSDTPVIILGRSPQATFCLDDSRVSRSHARIDWHGGSFQLTDLSFNGTYVRFADGEIVSLRRGSCTLHGSGSVGLGASPGDAGAPCVRFEVVHVGAAQELDDPDTVSDPHTLY